MKTNFFSTMLRGAARMMAWIGWSIGSAALAIALLTILDHFGIFPPESALFGVSFISPLWIMPLFIASAVVLLLSTSKLFWIPLTAGSVYFLLLGDVAPAALFSRFPQRAIAAERTLTVATLNVEYYTEGVGTVMHAIDNLDADIVLLGEHVLTPRQEAEMIPLLHGRHLIAGHPNSTAIVSRYPIVWWKEVELPSHEASLSGGNDPDEIVKCRHRSFIHALVRVDSHYVHVISVRFIAGRPKDHSLKEEIRWGRFMFTEQVNEAKFFTAYLSALHGPVIFGGDLNACPSSTTVSMISRIAEDAYMKNHVFGDLTFRTEFPTLRLDYLFSMNGVRSVRALCPKISVSDHFPVLASFILPDTTTAFIEGGAPGPMTALRSEGSAGRQY